MLKDGEGCAGSAAEAIDGLIGIADGEDIAFFASESLHDLDLCEVGILKFVKEDKARRPPLVGKNRAVVLQQIEGASNLLGERAYVPLLQHTFHSGENPRDLLTAAVNVSLAKSLHIFRFADPGDGHFAATHLADEFRIFRGSDQLILATAHEVEEIEKKLCGIRGFDEILEIEFAEMAAKENPEISVFDEIKALAMSDQKLVAKGVEGFRLQLGNVGA